MTTKTCPYYIVNSQEEFDKAVDALNGSKREALHEFPCIVGRDDILFQGEGNKKMDPFVDGETTYEYVLKTL